MHNASPVPPPAPRQETKDAFVGLGLYAKPVADPEEGRCLLELGYSLLDVRSAAEVDATGKLRGAVHVPFNKTSKKYDAEQVGGVC